MIRKTFGGLGALAVSFATATAAFAQDAAALAGPIKNPSVEQMATMVNKGDTTWMLISSALVLMMSIPGLALFYGGLVRTKNMLSVLMQVFMIVSITGLMWALFGYSIAFTSGAGHEIMGVQLFGGLSKAFMAGVTSGTYAATFSNGVYIPELSYFVFQMTFAMITPALFIGSFAERIKFWPLMLFTALWSVLVYYPVAHMVWYWAGPDFLMDTVKKTADGTILSQDSGFLFQRARLISRAGPWSISTPGSPVWSAAWCWASGSASARRTLRRIP